jgi:hypothetical protein
MTSSNMVENVDLDVDLSWEMTDGCIVQKFVGEIEGNLGYLLRGMDCRVELSLDCLAHL